MSKCKTWADINLLECKTWANEVSASCTSWSDEGSNSCSQWADEGSSECSQWSDQGKNECSSWADDGYNNCCDWWPCSWSCDALVWVSNWVCQGWYWVANLVCQGWYWVAKWVCKAWYWVAKWVCKGFALLVKLVCTVWNWVVKTVCVVWNILKCAGNAFLNLFRKKARGSQNNIKHVFVLMLENRSFDHMLGFSNITGLDAVSGGTTNIEGLTVTSGAGTGNLVDSSHYNTDPDSGMPVPASTPADFKIESHLTKDVEQPCCTGDESTSKADFNGDPGHEFCNVLTQLCWDKNSPTNPKYPDSHVYPNIKNDGFIKSYQNTGARPPNPTDPQSIMRCFTRSQLPVITALAEEFAVCDRWFSSLPGPTWPNRFFAHAATSGGLDDSPSNLETVGSYIDGYRFSGGTIFDALDDNCLDWRIFEGDEMPQSFAISGMDLNALEGRFTDFDEFAEKLNDKDFSDAYVFIEPNYGNVLPVISDSDFTCGNSMHPLDDVTRGERLIKDTYEAIRNSPHWESSVLLVVFDEHGGFYDHVAPPSAIPPGDVVVDPGNSRHGFTFDQLGVRVPALVISPLIKRGVIDHTEYDHTSLLATVQRLFGIKAMTRRDAAANDFLHLFSLATPRDTPATLPEPALSGFKCEDLAEVIEGDLEEALKKTLGKRADMDIIPASFYGFLQVAYRKLLLATPLRFGNERKQLEKQFQAVRTHKEAIQFFWEARQRMRAFKKAAFKKKPIDVLKGLYRQGQLRQDTAAE